MKQSDETPIYEAAPDEELMILTGQGHRDAFVTIVRRHQGMLVNFFRRMGVYSNEEDLAQETFVKVYKYRERYRPKAKFTTFLYLVARRIHLDYLRKRERERRGAQRLAEEAALAGHQADRSGDRKTKAVEALNTLSEEMRSVVVLNIYQGLRYQEIAEALDIPLGTVKTRMFHALRKLREAMGHYD